MGNQKSIFSTKMSTKFLDNCKKLRELMKISCVQIPGAFNGMTGRLCAQNGFSAVYLSGAAISASSGLPDIGVVTLDGFCKSIKEVSMASGLPIIADADTGFGEGEMIHKTVYEYFLSGASGFHIEDQVFPKRCGHLDGKALISTEDMVNKVKIAAMASKECSDGQFIIGARTDARGVIGVEETVLRSKAYIDAGADLIFPEGLHSKDEFKYVSESLKGYGPKGGPFLLANMTEFGKSEFRSQEGFHKMGYHCVIYPVSTLRIANKAIDDFLKTLKTEGTQEKKVESMQTRKELYATIKYTPGKEWYYPDATNK